MRTERFLAFYRVPLVLFFSLGLTTLCQAELRAVTGSAPPYQFSHNGKISGQVVDLFNCALANHQSGLTIQFLPWRRAINLLQNNDADLLFSLSDQVDPITRHNSMPMVLEKWHWYFISEPPSVESSIAVVAGSSEELWLKRQNYRKIISVESLSSAFKMLAVGRVQAVLSDSAKANYAMALNIKTLPSLKRDFIQFSTQRAYFSDKYIATHPGFIDQFNLAIDACLPVGTRIDPEMQNILRSVAGNLIPISEAEWLKPELLKKLKSDFDLSFVPLYERQWSSHSNQTPSQLVNDILDLEISKRLKSITEEKPGAITEIILTDSYGRNVAISHLTTDYWQGDEINFTSVQRQPDLPYHIRAVYFDNSTEQFQTQISLPIHSKSGILIGVIIFGIDLEEAYSLFDQKL